MHSMIGEPLITAREFLLAFAVVNAQLMVYLYRIMKIILKVADKKERK
jgi:hypothetical protein